MPTQQQIADHLGITQQAVSQQMAALGVDWKTASLDEVRLAYLNHLRGVAAGHRSVDGLDLARERALTEQVDRELKQLTLAEKQGQLVNLQQLEPAIARMVAAFRAELFTRDDKLKSAIDDLYGIDCDTGLIHQHTCNALAQLARYDAERPGQGHTERREGEPPGGEGAAFQLNATTKASRP